MIEGYTTEEIIECCADYIKDGRSIGLPVSRHEGRLAGKGTVGRKSFTDRGFKQVDEAHFTILKNTQIVGPYIERHKIELRENNRDRLEKWVQDEHKRRFTTWFMNLDLPNGDSLDDQTLRRLASRPRSTVLTFQVYEINSFTFYTETKDEHSKCQNSGVRNEAIDGNGQLTSYYGRI
jgi:hypothetical protein